MKLGSVSFLFSCCLATANAQYFSAGWKPNWEVPVDGQPAEPEAPKLPKHTPAPSTRGPAPGQSIFDIFDIKKLLTSQPSVSLFQRFNINITERVAEISASPWDNRIPLITDKNYNELVVNETLTAEEEKSRAWAFVITGAKSNDGGMSKFVDDVFDEAYNLTVEAKDLPNIKWGRIDYLNVTYLTTKWGIWNAPYLVVAQERGQKLWFFKPGQIRLRDGVFREFLKQEAWNEVPHWQSSYAPGGDKEYIMHYFATAMMNFYNTITWVPKWILFLFSGSIASVIINLLHKKDPPSKAEQISAARKKIVAEREAAKVTDEPSAKKNPTSGSSKSKQKKGKK